MALTSSLNIGDEARILSNSSTNFDNFRRMYSTHEDEIMIQFVAPKLFLFESYRFTLLQNSVVKELSPKMYYRPDYVAYEEYGTTNLWAMLLFINDIPTIEDFSVKNIYVPTSSIIREVAQNAYGTHALEQIVPLYEMDPVATPKLFTKHMSIPTASVEDISVESDYTPANIYFMRETFTLSITDVRNRYLELEDAPVVNSVNVIVPGDINYLKGKHYDIIRGNDGVNRLTWDPRKLSGGIGMMTTMTENIQVEVSYARKSI